MGQEQKHFESKAYWCTSAINERDPEKIHIVGRGMNFELHADVIGSIVAVLNTARLTVFGKSSGSIFLLEPGAELHLGENEGCEQRIVTNIRDRIREINETSVSIEEKKKALAAIGRDTHQLNLAEDKHQS